MSLKSKRSRGWVQVLWTLCLFPLLSLPLEAQGGGSSGGGKSLKSPKINDGFIINAPSGYGDRKAPKLLTVEFGKDSVEQTQARVLDGNPVITPSPVHEGTLVRNDSVGGSASLGLKPGDGKNIQIVLPEAFKTSVLLIDFGQGTRHALALASPRLILDLSLIAGLSNYNVKSLTFTFFSPVTLKTTSCSFHLSNPKVTLKI